MLSCPPFLGTVLTGLAPKVPQRVLFRRSKGSRLERSPGSWCSHAQTAHSPRKPRAGTPSRAGPLAPSPSRRGAGGGGGVPAVQGGGVPVRSRLVVFFSRRIARLICVRLKHLPYDFFGSVLGLLPVFLEKERPKHPLKKSYSKYCRRTQIR